MQAITVIPGVAGSVALSEIDEPRLEGGPILVKTLAVGVCGTDHEILDGGYGSAAPGRDRLVIGHESLGQVLDAPAGAGLAPGDFVVGIVRRPDPVPCPNCAVGEWDMCQNGRFTEHGIKALDGFASERFRLQADAYVKVDPSLGLTGVLLEPASILAKAWDHIERIGSRACWTPRRVLVTGAGPVGLLAALAARQRGYEVHVLDRVTTGPKPDLVRAVGATYHSQAITEMGAPPDVILECTGASSLVFEAIQFLAPNGIACLTGVSSGHRNVNVDAAGLNRELVLENNVVFGSVNANRSHYERAATLLAGADRGWLERVIARRVPLERWKDAYTRQPDDVKVVLQF